MNEINKDTLNPISETLINTNNVLVPTFSFPPQPVNLLPNTLLYTIAFQNLAIQVPPTRAQTYTICKIPTTVTNSVLLKNLFQKPHYLYILRITSYVTLN
jgi:hypothetical protein